MRRRPILYGLLFFQLVSLIIFICSFVVERSRDLLQLLAISISCVLEIFWFNSLTLIFSKSQWLNEPQSYLFILMFLSTWLRDGIAVILRYTDKTICPYQYMRYWNSSSGIFQEEFQVNQGKIIPFTIIQILTAINPLCLLFICINRFFLSCRRRDHIISMTSKIVTIFVLLVLAVSSVVPFSNDAPWSKKVLIQLVTFFLCLLSYLLVFFLLVGYSARNQNDDASIVQYFTLWIIFIMNAALEIFIERGLSLCVWEIDFDGNLRGPDLDSTFWIIYITTFGNSIAPLIILFVDKNIRKTLLHYFPLTVVPETYNNPLQNEDSEHGEIGTVIEDPTVGPQDTMATVDDNPAFSGQRTMTTVSDKPEFAGQKTMPTDSEDLAFSGQNAMATVKDDPVFGAHCIEGRDTEELDHTMTGQTIENI